MNSTTFTVSLKAMSDPRVLSFSANTTTGKTARFTVGTDIIDYMESSRAFGREDLSDPNADGRFQRRMVAIPDKKWNVVTPMVLTISNQNQLYLVRKDDESESGDGWKLIDLSQAFKNIMGNSIRVRAHAAGWTDHDRITIAVAVDDGSSEKSRVFVAYDLSSRTSDWENISWIDCGSREDIRVEGIRILDGGDGIWTVVVAGDRGPNDTLYLLRNTFQKSFAQALIFNPAVTLEEILDFEVAVHPTLGAGIAVLGISGGTRDLSFRPFPAYKADGSFSTIPPVEPLPCPAGANVLESGLTKLIQKGRRRTYMGSDIYVGGQGVHLIQASDVLKVVINGGEIPLTVITSPEAAPNVRDLIVGEAPDGSASVWSLLQNGDLNTVKKVSANAAWGEPLRLRVDVQAIAPVHGDEHLTTSLLMVYANGQASFLARDASQGIWQERPLTVANPEEVTKVTCYGTTLRVLSEGSLPQIGTKVKVSASVLSSVVLNGCVVFIGPNVSFETETDFNGSISLFDRVRSLTPAIYRFEIEGFNECIDVNPASGMHERFQSMTADELRSATISTPNGEEHLLPESFRTGADRHQVDAIAGGLNNLTKLASSTNGVVAGVSLVSPGAEFSSILKAQSLPDEYQWGIQTDSKGVRILLQEDINKLIHSGSVGEFFKNLGDTIVDFFEGIGHAIKEGVTFVIHKVKESKVFQFICKIGNTVKKFVVETLEQIGSAITWLWNQIKTGIEKVWEFLKFVFDWGDILRVRDFIVDFIDGGLEEIPHFVDSVKDSVESSFDAVITQVNQWKSIASSQPEVSKPQKSSTPIAEFYKGTQSIVDKIMGNSAISWICEQLQPIFNEIIEINGFDLGSEDENPITSFTQGLINDFISELSDCFEQIKTTFTKIFGDDSLDIDDLNVDKILTLMVDIGSEAIETFLQLIKKILLRVLDLVKNMVGLFHSLISAKIRFSFIEKLVKFVTDGKTEIDTSFRIVDAISLVLAVPISIAHKIAFGEPLIKVGDVVSLPFKKDISVQSGMGRVQRIVNFISLLAQLTANGALVFAAFDKKK